jgi:hypothetical protein
MGPSLERVERLIHALRLEMPLLALYDSDPEKAFEPLVHAAGRACCFAYYERWRRGETLVVSGGDGDFDHPSRGCPGMQRAFGLCAEYPPWMANFLTEGKNGAATGEGLKATPEIAAGFLERVRPMRPAGGHVLFGPLRLEAWEKVRSVTFFADPDRLSALMTLASFWSADPDEIAAPFSSGCGLLWREMANLDRDRAVLGCTDIAMRRYLPPDILCLTVAPERFARMVDYPDSCFLEKKWWRELLESRRKNSGGRGGLQ